MTQPHVLPGPGPAQRLTFEEFLACPSPVHAEWVRGELVPMVGVSREHQSVSLWLLQVLARFVQAGGHGLVFYEPFLMRLAPDGPARSPDIMFVETGHVDRVRENYLDGPCDIAVEVVSPGSGATDRGEKYYEYEVAGIPEYWLIDPHRRVAEFYRLGPAGVYELVRPEGGVFESAVLPGMQLPADWLWVQPPLPEVEAALGLR